MKYLVVAIIITILALLLAGWAAIDSHAQGYDIQCMMLAGCWYHPDGGYPATFWMWHPVYAWLQPHQYTQVYRESDWRWVEVTE
jgi:hypothetical protein